MSGPGRNEPCPCGTGKKFKKCCGAPTKSDVAANSPGAPRRLAGDDARTEMGRILAGNSRAEALLEEVAGFYGPYLTLVEDPVLPSSSFKYEFEAQDLRFTRVVVSLRTGTARVRESLCHELLHLRLPIQGFPGIRAIMFPPSATPQERTVFLKVHSLIANVVQHAINLTDFLALGHDIDAFLGDRKSVPSYRQAAEEFLARGQGRCITSPWWCQEYFLHWMSSFHRRDGSGDRAAAENVLHEGSRVHQDLPRAADRMRQWIDSSGFQHPDHYKEAIEALFSIMEYTPPMSWYRFDPSQRGHPVAIPLSGFHR